MNIYIFFFGGWLALLAGCSHASKGNLFHDIPASTTGIQFSNNITESDSVNPFLNEYVYAGAGVAAADFNNDGRVDIFFAGNQVSSRLYINEGKNHFTDITEKAGLQTTAWCTGASVVDINNDGFEDIYICVSGNTKNTVRRNLLYINQQNLTFREEAEEYGLAFSGYSTQAVFLDYDRDGDLDMYLLNHRLDKFRPNNIVKKDTTGNSPAADKLFMNTGIDPAKGHPMYSDVSIAAGIKEDGYGLGVSVSDLNNDGWPDIYVSNDYLANDELWLNNKNGTFTNRIASSVKHESYSSMGVDAADLNNDGRPDLVTLDMMPEKNMRKKTMYSFLSYERYQMERDAGYQPEFIRNMLQLNNGTLSEGDTAVPFFSEIGQLAGISQTDWSWGVLLADYNNDGWKDMYITNGIWRDLTNADFVQFREDNHMEDNSKEEERKLLVAQLATYKPILLPNYIYLSNKDYTFSDRTAEAGPGDNTASNGAAYADIDNDGDLDLIVNNVNSRATVLINVSADSSRHFFNCVLKGTVGNRDAVGAKVSVYCKNHRQVVEQYPVKGYLSSVSKTLHFGLGPYPVIDSVIISWPDGNFQKIDEIKADSTVVIRYTPTGKTEHASPVKAELFEDVTTASLVEYKHTETFFNDYSFQRLLTQKYSQLGPFISVGDVNGDGMTDFFIGGAYNYPGSVFLQQIDGTFSPAPIVRGKKEEEDMGSCLFDANGDGRPDLLIAGGSDEFSPGSPVYRPRLYLNSGNGNFVLSTDAVSPAVNTSASIVVGNDFDGDGKEEIFIGGRVSANFPTSPPSFILRNDHGLLRDVTAEVCPALKDAGMVTAAVWVDFDNDHHTDLVVAGEWMPVRFFKNENGKLVEVTSSTGLTGMSGQWKSLVAEDIDKDGDMDIVAGNLGANNKFGVSPDHPLLMYAKDIDNNGVLDPISFYYIKNEQGSRQLYPAVSRDLLSEQVPSIKKQFLHYDKYGVAGFKDIFKDESNMLALTCEETRSCLFENKGNGKFAMHALPEEAQFAPVNAMICEDLDGDGNIDLLLAGNEYQTEIFSGRYDASYGLFLKGDGDYHFVPIDPVRSGFIVNGDVKDMKTLTDARGNKLILVAINDERMKVFRIRNKKTR